MKKTKKLNKVKLTLSVSPGTKEKLEQQSAEKGFNSISSYIDVIASGQLTTIDHELLKQIRKI